MIDLDMNIQLIYYIRTKKLYLDGPKSVLKTFKKCSKC